MKKSHIRMLLSAGLVTLALCGCGKQPPAPETVETTLPVQTEPAPTIPADGNPNDVTCKGSYTGTPDTQAVAARVGEAELTNAELQTYYWAEVAAYRQSGETPAPDFDKPLDTQACEADESVASWQQYFLRRALNTWHSAQALILQGQEEGLPAEEAYQPDLEAYEEYMTGMPATKFLYRYEKSYQPNTMHQAWLDAIPETLEDLAAQKGCANAEELARSAFGTSLDALKASTESYNRGYMYYTNLSYFIEPTQEELDAHYAQWAQENPDKAQGSGAYVNLRHILLLPEGGAEAATEEAWQARMTDAEKLLEKWQYKTKHTEATFADMAHTESEDVSSALDGGAYLRIRQGQLMDEIDAWCFDESRQSGDTTILRTQSGIHILYFSGSTAVPQAQAEDAFYAGQQADLLTLARTKYPIAIEYSAITLAEAEGTVSLSDLLYPDIAHERFPEIPLYLQQDYPTTKYGAYWIRGNGCGITTMAMLASYMTDEEWTPPEMCARYGVYSHKNGTDGMIYINEPPVLGFYLRERTFDAAAAKQALEEGYIVINVQTKGYWTRGGHYIAIEKMHEDGTLQVRDSNIFNYGKLEGHQVDSHTWGSITRNGHGFWVFEKKITRLPNCARCGGSADTTGTLLQQEYLCEKCTPALLRRNTFLAFCGQ